MGGCCMTAYLLYCLLTPNDFPFLSPLVWPTFFLIIAFCTINYYKSNQLSLSCRFL